MEKKSIKITDIGKAHKGNEAERYVLLSVPEKAKFTLSYNSEQADYTKVNASDFTKKTP